MADITKGLNAAGGVLSGVNALFTPTGAVTVLVEGLRAWIAARRARNEDVPVDLEEKLQGYDAALDEVEALGAEYWTIPEKPADPPQPATDVFRVTDDGGQPRE